MKPEQCFRCLRTFSELNPANPKLATSLLMCIKCGQINLGKSALEIHYKIRHSSPEPHTLCDGCASSLGRTTERVFRTDNFDTAKNGNKHVQSSPSGHASVKKSNTAYDSSKAFWTGSSSRNSQRILEKTKGLDSRSASRKGKDRMPNRSRTGSPLGEKVSGESSKKKHGRFGKFFK